MDFSKNFLQCLGEYKKLLIIEVDNVASKEWSETRQSLRGRAEILMGNDTVNRELLRREAKEDAGLNSLIDIIRGNIGFCFTNEDISALRADIEEPKKPVPTKAGQISLLDVYLEPQVTKLDPSHTLLFQALQIPTRIYRGTIKVLVKCKIIAEGEEVGDGGVDLLSVLGPESFSFGINVKYVYEFDGKHWKRPRTHKTN